MSPPGAQAVAPPSAHLPPRRLGLLPRRLLRPRSKPVSFVTASGRSEPVRYGATEGQPDRHARPLARCGSHVDHATEHIGDDVMDDVHPEARAACAELGREEGSKIRRLTFSSMPRPSSIT